MRTPSLRSAIERCAAALTSALVFAVVLPGNLAAQGTTASTEVLTNQSVLGMSAARLNRDLLLAKINSTRNTFDVTVNGLINLYQGKVHQDVIRSMIPLAADPKLGQPSKTPEVLTNDSVVAMTIARLPRAIVLAKIHNTASNFDVSASGLVALTQAKVHTEVIRAMVVKGGSSPQAG